MKDSSERWDISEVWQQQHYQPSDHRHSCYLQVYFSQQSCKGGAIRVVLIGGSESGTLHEGVFLKRVKRTGLGIPAAATCFVTTETPASSANPSFSPAGTISSSTPRVGKTHRRTQITSQHFHTSVESPWRPACHYWCQLCNWDQCGLNEWQTQVCRCTEGKDAAVVTLRWTLSSELEQRTISNMFEDE